MEYHGWTGLIWLGYFHWAVPAGFGLFLIWANGFVDVIANRKVLFNVVAIIFGALVYYTLYVSLTYFFSQGPTDYLLLSTTPAWKYHLFRNAFYVIIPLMPVGTFFILKLFMLIQLRVFRFVFPVLYLLLTGKPLLINFVPGW